MTSDAYSTLAAVLPRSEQVVQLMSPLPISIGDHLILGNAGTERARVVAIDDSGLLVTVERQQPRAHELLSWVTVQQAAPALNVGEDGTPGLV